MEASFNRVKASFALWTRGFARTLPAIAVVGVLASPAARLLAADDAPPAPRSILDEPLPPRGQRQVFVSPFLPTAESSIRIKGAIEVDFLPELVEMIPMQGVFDLVQFPLPDGTVRDLWLTEFRVTDDNTTVVVMKPGKDGEPVADCSHAPLVRTFRGHVTGVDQSLVYLSFSPTSVSGFINIEGQVFSISNGPRGELPVVISDMENLPDGAINWYQYACEVRDGGEPTEVVGDGGLAALPSCKVLEMAFETDNEFRALFVSDQAAIDYAVQIAAGMNTIFYSEVNLYPLMSFLRVWSPGVTDPWNAIGTGAQLDQFAAAWGGGGGPAGSNPRDLAHMISARNLGGGVAFLNSVCSLNGGFAVSANLSGFFPYPLQNNNSQNWDIMVTSHEMGHNAGCSHTHDLGIDNCAGGVCITNGTIMSYCHLCPGGLSNIVLTFAPGNKTQMDTFLAGAGCLSEPCPIYDPTAFRASDGVYFDAVRLTWSAPNVAAQRFQIERRALPDAAFASLASSVPSTATSFDDTTAAAGIVYEYRIRAVRVDTGAPSAWVVPDIGFVSATSGDPCPTDLNNDGQTDSADLGQLLSSWGSSGGDVNGDGTTDSGDIGTLLSAWGDPCNPNSWATVLDFSPNAAVVTSPALRDAIIATGFPWRVRDNATQIEMLLVPPGTYAMGCSASNQTGCGGEETPVHAVTITSPFYLGRYEVTQAQWTAIMGSNPSFFQGSSYPDAANRPVERVSWNMIQGFLSSTGMRLPTEAEWEYAYRAGTTTAFHGFSGAPSGTNNDTLVGNIGWISTNAGTQSRPVGQKAANSLGLHDMAGNVWEWTNDWYSSTYYSSSPSINPPGPATGIYRVLRSGSFNHSAGSARASHRGTNYPPTQIFSDFGFRVARTAGIAAPSIAAIAPSQGPTGGGTTITITGTNLSGTNGVTVGGTAATSIVVVNSTTVTAVTPAGSVGTKTVAVTTAGGTVSLASAFTYVAAPTIASVSPSSGPTAGGTTITITGTNLSGTTGVTVGGAAATNIVVANSTTVTAVTPAGSVGTKTVAVTTAGGTVSLASAFTYVAAPTIASVSPSSGPTTGGTTITITGTNLSGTTGVTVGGAAATNIVVVNSSTVTAVTPAGTAGLKSVSLTTSGGTGSLSNAFTYFIQPTWATVLEIAPDPAVVTSTTLRSAITATGLPWRVRDNATQIEMLLVPSGTFSMGCSASTSFGCAADESPVHTVTLTNAFYMGRYEVTQAQWTAMMGSNPSTLQSATAEVPAAQVPNRPVETVSWTTLQGFLTATGLRLPTEAEWEYSYRAGTTTAFHSMPAFPSGTNSDSQLVNIAWYNANSGQQTRPVGQKAANGLGLHDMSGNAWEWVNDWYSSTYYSSSPSTNPAGPATGTLRVARGGAHSHSTDSRSSTRLARQPSISDSSLGFRVARNP